MILILLGTQHNEFTRLLDEVQTLINNKIINEEVVVQAGFTKYVSDDMKIFDLTDTENLNNLINQANLIITHGGVGSIITALKSNKKVIAVPRLKKYLEHVNDHQREIVNTFNEKGYLIGIQNVEDLSESIKKAKNFVPEVYKGDNLKLLNYIDNYIKNT